jgi:D-sedoheptulose 7-phosphate isomerase
MIESIRSAVAESVRLKQEFFAANEDRIVDAASRVCRTLENGCKLLLFGNGGSAADAQHIAAELVGRFYHERRALAALALTTNTSILTAVGNDYGYEQVFVRQIQAMGRAGDMAIGISTSGNSRNVCAAATVAKEMGLATIGLTGCDGGLLASLVDCHLHVPSRNTARIQEVHILVGHVLCELVEKHMKGR